MEHTLSIPFGVKVSRNPRQRPAGERRGSALLATLCFAAVLSICLGSYLAVSYRALYLSNRDVQFSRSMQLAEMGVEEAYWAINNNYTSWTGWTINGGARTASRTLSFSYPGESGVVGEVSITITNFDALTTSYLGTDATSIKIVSNGKVTVGNGISTVRSLEAYARPTPIFYNAIGTTVALYFSSAGGVVDSYDAWPINPSTRARDTLALYTPTDPTHLTAANSAAVVTGPTALRMSSTQIYGYVASDDPQSTSSSKVLGPSTASGVSIDPARVNKVTYQPPVPTIVQPTGGSTYYDSVTHVSEVRNSVSLGTPNAPVPSVYFVDYVNLSGGNVLTIDGPVILKVLNWVQVQDTSMIRVSGTGTLDLRIDEQYTTTTPVGATDTGGRYGIYLGGNGIQNDTYDPQRLSIQVGVTPATSANSRFATSQPFYGSIYLPNDNIVVDSTFTLYGAMSGQRVRFANGAAANIHYDQSLVRKGYAGIDNHAYVLASLREVAYSTTP